MEITMVKICFCAIAMLIGGLIGANAPAEWRSDSARLARTTALAGEPQSLDRAIVNHSFQR
jgi:hypothetical protein